MWQLLDQANDAMHQGHRWICEKGGMMSGCSVVYSWAAGQNETEEYQQHGSHACRGRVVPVAAVVGKPRPLSGQTNQQLLQLPL